MPWNRATFSGDSSVVTTSQETRPASAEVPSGFVAMPSETPIANSSGGLSSMLLLARQRLDLVHRRPYWGFVVVWV